MKNIDFRVLLAAARSTGSGPLAFTSYQIMQMMIPHDLTLLLLLKIGITILPVFLIFRCMFRKNEELDWRDPLLLLLFAPLFYLAVRSFSAATLLIPVSAFVLWSFYRLARTKPLKDALLTLTGLWAMALIHPEAGLPAALAFALWLPFSGILRGRRVAVLFCSAAAFLPVLVRLLPLWQRGMFPAWGAWSLTAAPIRVLTWLGVPESALPDAVPFVSPALLRSWKILAVVSLTGTILCFGAGLGRLFRKRHELRSDPIASLMLFALLTVLAAFPVMLMMKPGTSAVTAALPVFLPASLITGLGMAELRRLFGTRAVRITALFFCVMASGLFGFIVFLERSGGSPGPEGYGPMLKNQLSVIRSVQEAGRHARFVDLDIDPETLRLDPMVLKFLSDFLMKNDPPIREQSVKTRESVTVRIVRSGPPGTGFLRAEVAEQPSAP